MKTEIIAVGTELLLGQIVNSNAAFLSEQLNAIGFPVYYHSVVGDNPHRLQQQLEIARSRSDIIVLTGGLGPTKDDLTKDTLGQFLGLELILDAKAMKHVQSFFTHRRIKISSNNERQAMVIEGSEVFPNDHGLAVGIAIEKDHKHYLMFPGPPKELKPMFEHYAQAYLRSLRSEETIIYSRVMRFCGIGESMLEEKLQDVMDEQSNPTIAPLAKQGEVTLRLTSWASDEQSAQLLMEPIIEEIIQRVGIYHYGWDEEQLEEVFVHALAQKKWTLATAESCTGGLISHSITTVDGVSHVFVGGIVCYTTKVKEEAVGLSKDIIRNDGVISKAAAKGLAEAIRTRFQSDIGLSITGVAGPDKQESKPVGLIYIGLALPDRTVVHEMRLAGTREMIQTRAAKLAIFHAWREISKKQE